MLTKSQLLQGARFTKELKIEGLGAVTIRALSDSELTGIEAKSIKAMADGGVNITAKSTDENLAEGLTDPTLLITTQKRRNWEVVALALSLNETWTPEEAGMLPEKVIQQLVEEVELLSRGGPEQADNFRGNKRGATAGATH